MSGLNRYNLLTTRDVLRQMNVVVDNTDMLELDVFISADFHV